MAFPLAIGVLVAVVAALTLAPALLSIGRHFGLFEPARPMRTRGWRRIGTAIVRWPGPILVATIAVALIGLLALPGYKTSYDARPYMPATAPANVGYAAAERHFSQARLNPELLMIEADHDLRNPTDMILLERVAKAVFHTDGIAQVQSITRPLGTPLDHTSIPFQISAGNSAQINNLPFQQARAADLLKQVGVIDDTVDVLRQQYALQQQSSCGHRRAGQGVRSRRSPRPRTCATRSPTSTTSSGPCATTSIGSHTVSTSRCAPRCGRSSTRSTASTR